MGKKTSDFTIHRLRYNHELLSNDSGFTTLRLHSGFTIVELLVVIVVIGLLATVTMVSYSGVSTKAKVASLQSDLANSAIALKLFNATNGYYPSTISTDCDASPTTSTNLCLKASLDNDYTTTPYTNPTTQSFRLTATNGPLVYSITDNSTVTEGIISILDPADWLTIGTQIWAKANLNVGTMVTGVTNQTNNSTLEKYCYNNLESNCTTYGALYQWNEAMQYVTTPGTQGICPTGSHIPTDSEWKTLEMFLGMTQVQADATGFRGTDQGTQLKSGGSSGLNTPLTGYRFNIGYSYLLSDAYLWSSSESGASAWNRRLLSSQATVDRLVWDKQYGFSVRCVGN